MMAYSHEEWARRYREVFHSDTQFTSEHTVRWYDGQRWEKRHPVLGVLNIPVTGHTIQYDDLISLIEYGNMFDPYSQGDDG